MMVSLSLEWTNKYQHFCRHARRHRKAENNRVPLSGLAEDLHCDIPKVLIGALRKEMSWLYIINSDRWRHVL